MPRVTLFATLVSLLPIGVFSPATAGHHQDQVVVRHPPPEPREGSVDND